MRVLLLGLWVATWAWTQVGARATRMVPLSLEDLAKQAVAVVHGRVVAVETGRDASKRILTRVLLVPLEVWKGRIGGSPIEVVAGGGVLGDRAVELAGQARYAVGDEVVSFLVRNPAGEWVTLGLAQGRFEVRLEAGTGRRLVSNPFWGETSGGAVGAALQGVGPERRVLTLDDLKRRTQEAPP